MANLLEGAGCLPLTGPQHVEDVLEGLAARALGSPRERSQANHSPACRRNDHVGQGTLGRAKGTNG